ncbi:MAG: TetR/AcrR family transcriptional regulator [Mycetocola sp.]
MRTAAAPTVTPVSDRSPRAADPRPARTRAAVLAAVERLSIQQDATLTVGSIAAEAGVSRSALYGQFRDLDELLATLLIDTSRRIGAADLTGRQAGESPAALARRSLGMLVAHVDSHRVFYTASLSWRVSREVYDDVLRSYAEQIRATIEVIRDVNQGEDAQAEVGSGVRDARRVPRGDDADAAASFIAGGLIALLTAWLRTGCEAPVEVVVDRLLAQMPAWLVGE